MNTSVGSPAGIKAGKVDAGAMTGLAFFILLRMTIQVNLCGTYGSMSNKDSGIEQQVQ